MQLKVEGVLTSSDLDLDTTGSDASSGSTEPRAEGEVASEGTSGSTTGSASDEI